MYSKIGKRDIDILRILNSNSREYDSSIAKKIGISKQAVGYRIREMQKKGIITNFYTEFDTSKLGFDSYYVFLELENITNEDEKRIIDGLTPLPNVGWVISAVGKANIILLVYARTHTEFESLIFSVKNICSKYLREASFSILTKSQKPSYRFLEINLDSIQTEKSLPIKIDSSDFKIMEIISQNCRENFMTIAKKSRLSLDIVRYRLKKLRDNKLIKGFRPRLDVNRIGLQWYLLTVKLQSIDERKKRMLLDYLIKQKETYYITSTIGKYDLMIDLHVKNSEDIVGYFFRLRQLFPDIVGSYEILLVVKEYKMSYLPCAFSG